MQRFIISLLTIIILSGCGQSEAAVLGISASGSIVSQPSLAACNTAANIKECRVTSPQVVTTAIVKAADREITFSEGGYVTFTGVGALTGLKEARPEWFGASLAASAATNTTAIQSAINAVTDADAGEVILSELYTTSGSVTLYRGVTLKATAIQNGIYANGDFPAIKFATKNGYFPLNVVVENMTIQGSNNAAHTTNYALEMANGMQYCTFRNLRIYQMGGTSVKSLGGADLGAIYNRFDNVQIINPNGYAMYLTGNIGQNTFTNLRVYGLANASAGIVLEDANNGSTVLSNTFIGGGVESGGASGYPTAGFKAVWFKNAALYAAFSTKFINFYTEPGGPTGAPAGTAENQVTTGYYIEAAKGVHISGGYNAFAHVGIWLAGQYAEGVNIDNVNFVKSNGWNADTSTGAMIRVADSTVVVHVGPGCRTSVSGTYLWPMLLESVSGQSVYGYRDLSDKRASLRQISEQMVAPTLQRYSTLNDANSAALTDYTRNASGIDTLRRKMGTGTDVVIEQYTGVDIAMTGTDTGGAQGKITGIHSANFTARASSAVANGFLFVDSADNKLKFKDSSGVVNLLY